MDVVTLPREIIERAERVLDYHRASKHTPESVRQIKPITELSGQPGGVRTFCNLPKVSLPTGLLDLPVAALSLMHDGLAALPESHVRPPQDLKTLATWLYMAYGIVTEKKFGIYKYRQRTCPSAGGLFPSEIYVAAFAIQGLEPGLWSFNPREFTLSRLREGPATLAQIKRGRPDLEFLKSVPAALLVSSIFWRSAWKYRVRGYRMALLDAGHLIANLVTCANGLGIQTMTRLRMNDKTTRELIGIPPEPDFGSYEAVQTMVVWADDASSPLPGGRTRGAPPVVRDLPPIERQPLSPQCVPYGSIVAAHQDCVAPGLPIREIRPPLTELSPLPVHVPLQVMPLTEAPPHGPSLRQVLLQRRSSRDFIEHSISRNKFLAINHAGFRTGTFVPLFPDGPYPALIRPFWVIHDVTGMIGGIWYYHPPADRWVMLKRGDFRRQTALMCLQQPRCGNASALCVMTANLHALMGRAGPDLYRVAHLEAGIASQRMALAATATGIGCCPIGQFYDEELRHFVGLQQTGWEVIYCTALGIAAPETEPLAHPALGVI
jgi:SagB-type dehydrogenase family enzyme